MASRGSPPKLCSKAEDAAVCGEGKRSTKRKAPAAGRRRPRKGCSSDGEAAAFKKTEADAGFSEVGKISKQKQGQEESAEDFDTFIAKLEEEHEKYWGEYTSDGVKRFEYKDYSSYPVTEDGFIVLGG
ncbi:hypothetical protein VPH35_132084 [Triticum aestivum]